MRELLGEIGEEEIHETGGGEIINRGLGRHGRAGMIAERLGRSEIHPRFVR